MTDAQKDKMKQVAQAFDEEEWAVVMGEAPMSAITHEIFVRDFRHQQALDMAYEVIAHGRT